MFPSADVYDENYSPDVDVYDESFEPTGLNRKDMVKFLTDRNVTVSAIREEVKSWILTDYLECLLLMSELHPWEHWYDTPWERIFDEMLMEQHHYLMKDDLKVLSIPDKLYRRAIWRLPEEDIPNIAKTLKSSRPFIFSWLMSNFDPDKSATVDTLFIFTQDRDTSPEDLEALWFMVLQPGSDGVCYDGWLCEYFLSSPYFPIALVDEFINNPVNGAFGWGFLVSLALNERYTDLILKHGGIEKIADMVDDHDENWYAVECELLPSRVRAKAALNVQNVSFPAWGSVSRIINNANFDLVKEVELLLREEALEAGLDSTLPIRMLLETLWEPGSPGWVFITGWPEGEPF